MREENDVILKIEWQFMAVFFGYFEYQGIGALFFIHDA